VMTLDLKVEVEVVTWYGILWYAEIQWQCEQYEIPNVWLKVGTSAELIYPPHYTRLSKSGGTGAKIQRSTTYDRRSRQ